MVLKITTAAYFWAAVELIIVLLLLQSFLSYQRKKVPRLTMSTL